MMRDGLDHPPGLPPLGLDAAARRALSAWLLLAVGSLAVAGALALLLALSRTPGAQNWLPWPWETFFKKALVTHVVFSFIVWYLAMLGGLAAAARPGRVNLVGLVLAVAGAVLLLVPALTNQGEPALNNYVPVLVHPLFYAGLGLLAAGVAVPVVNLLLRPPVWGGPLAVGVGCAGVIYLLALLCFGLAWMGLPAGTRLGSYDEALFWGGGHLLQFVYTALLLTGWQVLGETAFGKPPLGPQAWRFVAALVVLAALPGPVLYAFNDAGGEALRRDFTRLYWIGLPVPPLVAALATLRSLFRQGRGEWRSPAYLGLVLSLVLWAVGGAFGLFATGGDTRTPAHYHAEIGATNLAFMGLFFAILLPVLLKGGRNSRAQWLQFWLYGAGQTLFCIGMFVAGTEGVHRKVAGEAQGLDSLGKIVGMGMTGLGGVLAVIGGVTFVWLALTRLAAGPRRQPHS